MPAKLKMRVSRVCPFGKSFIFRTVEIYRSSLQTLYSFYMIPLLSVNKLKFYSKLNEKNE